MAMRPFIRISLHGFFATCAAGLFFTPQTSSKAADFAPALIFDMGGKFDKSFNEAAYNGAERFKTDSGIAYRDFEVTNESQRDQAIRTLAKRGASVIALTGFAFETPIRTIAPEFPEVKFCIIDSAIPDVANVRSYTFKEHEGSFLVGLIAANSSKTGKVGFVGGMDIPLIRNFAAGYEEGVKYANPGAEIFVNMTGSTPAAWNDPARGSELAKSQFDRGADVVYAAAGATGLGVLQAAADAKKYSIGVDSNQNHLYPGSVLTSMVKRVDNAVIDCFKSAQDNSWKAGHIVWGLKEEGVGYALDDNNKPLLDDALKAKVEAVKADIISEKIKVKGYNQ
jgi:basic membrane protein A and related proteins